MPNSVTWADIEPGAIITYRHLSRARRLAGKPLTIRTGKVENVYPPEPGVRVGQISVSALNKDGSANRALGRFNVGIDFIESVTRPHSSCDVHPCGASLSARCFNGVSGCATHPRTRCPGSIVLGEDGPPAYCGSMRAHAAHDLPASDTAPSAPDGGGADA